MQTHIIVLAIVGLCLFCGLVYWITQIRKDLVGQIDSQHSRIQNVEQAVQYFQRQHILQQQMFHSMSQPQPQPPLQSVRKVKPVVPPKSKKPIVPPPPTPEEMESPDELDELLKDELAELTETPETDTEEVEELSTDSLKKTTKK